MTLNLDPVDKELVERVTKALQSAESKHRRFVEKADHHYARYRNFQQWRDARNEAAEPDRDTFWNDATREWGAKLSIPYGFSTIETVVPRMLDHSPRMLVLPRDKVATENVSNMKALIDFQQDSIDFELVLQDVAKDGLMYGLGVLKSFWRTETALERANVPHPMGGGFIETKNEKTVFDSNDGERVEPRDWIADPFGYDMRTVRWVIHRTWRPDSYVGDKIKSSAWRQDWPFEEIVRLGSSKRGEVWSGRDQASGFPTDESEMGNVHEVLEFHDRVGQKVITILDRQVPVQVADNPYWHKQLPFQLYRPTRLGGELYGVPELEPLQDLLDEMDTLRSQRRDNATLVLQTPIVYQEGLVDPSDIKFGPGMGIPVNGLPQELLNPIRIGDIPNSSYMEEDRLTADIERTSGISEAISGGEGSAGGASATATGAQLVHGAASVRIRNKTRLLEKETIRNATRQWVKNNQQKIVSSQDVPVQQAPEPGGNTPAWEWITVGPNELAGEFDVICEGGSTAPENTPQKRYDAQLKLQLLQGPLAQLVDPRRVATSIIRDLGEDKPEAWLLQSQQIPAAVLQTLIAQGKLKEADAVAALEMVDQAGGQVPPDGGQQSVPSNGNTPQGQVTSGPG